MLELTMDEKEKRPRGRPRSMRPESETKRMKRERNMKYRQKTTAICITTAAAKNIRRIGEEKGMSNKAVVTLLVSMYQEHSARNPGSVCSSSGGKNKKNHQGDDSESSASEASLPPSLPSPAPGFQHPREPDSAPNIDANFIKKEVFIHVKEEPVDDIEDDDKHLDFDEHGWTCQDLEQKGEEKEILGVEQEQELEEETEDEESRGMPTTSKSGLHLKVKAGQAVDADCSQSPVPTLCSWQGRLASKCTTCGLPLTISVTHGNGTADHVARLPDILGNKSACDD